MKCRCGSQNMNDQYEVATDAEGFTSCCGAQSTYMDDGYGGWTLCCKCCCAEVTGGVEQDAVYIRLV